MAPGSTRKLRVLLTNDDGPPGPGSPYLIGWYQHLTQNLGWDLKVVIPSTQKSWIGGAFHTAGTINGRYYYPKDTDGQGEISSSRRGLKEGEIGEWVLLDASPASCANIALQNLFPGEIDLVISGPNFGRNASSALTLSSGTLGAAFSSSLSGVRSIALSYGNMTEHIPTTFHKPAFELSSRIIQRLIENWSPHDNRVLYGINIPMVERLLHEDGMRVYWTSVWKSNYRRMFTEVPQVADNSSRTPDVIVPREGGGNPEDALEGKDLAFRFNPDYSELLSKSAPPEGTDSWALNVDAVSVTPYLTNFAELPESEHSFSSLQDREWKFE
ncbi:sure-like protein [Thelephora terrestris]|uniref:Sure-like protein n=1 Tax=Thelephora terrestris TaxID=56493 RepID=A0A9P6H523_9AGAM|nr:sure-like protein [Thelephora terrestris]